MPWNRPSGSGDDGTRGPWHRPDPPDGGGGGKPPDLEELLRRSQDRLRRYLPGGGRGFTTGSLIIIVLAIVVVWLFSGIYFVGAREQGVVLRFGKFVARTAPGPNYHLPWPIETVETPEVTKQNQINIGYGQVADQNGQTSNQDIPEESLMLTGDENIIDIEFTVLWQIKDIFQWAFDVRNGEENVRNVAEAAMREVIGKSNFQYAQTEGRTKIEQDTKELMQKILDEYRSGVRIAQVQLQRADPPQDVLGAFRDVQAARADKERAINEANTYRNQVVPRAKGEAASIVQRAEGYKATTVARARGDAQRFDQVYEQYNKAKDITAERLYLETIEEVLRNTTKVMVEKNGTATGVLPYLPLPDLRQATPPPAPPRQAPAPGPTQGQGGTR